MPEAVSPSPAAEAAAAVEVVDVLIVGAGISGIDAAWHLQRRLPHKNYAILEARERIGGTWDLFRYPGIRSDSDMYTLGYSFKPWTDEDSIAADASRARRAEVIDKVAAAYILQGALDRLKRL